MENNKVLYRHLKPNGEVFYIGIGNKDRPYSKKRNKLWKRVVNKYGYTIDILKKDMSWKDAVQIEKILISWYGRIDLGTGTLVNMTDGGEGNSGYIYTDEIKKKIGDKSRGRKPVFTKEWKDKLSKSGMGRELSKSSIEKMMLSMKSRKPIVINNINYISISEASRILNVSRYKIKKMI